MKGKKRIMVAWLIICLTLLSSSFACTAQSNADDAAKNFEVTIVDENGNAVEGTELFLYSFLDGKVVASEKTDSEGKARIQYFPHLDNLEPSLFVYGDYFIYAVKDGYSRTEYNTTKIYGNLDYCSKDELDFCHRINMEKHIIKLEKEKMVSEMKGAAKVSKEELAKQTVMDKVRRQLIAEKKLTKEAPIHVLTEEDYRIFEQKGIVTREELKAINADESRKSVSASNNSELKNKVTPIIKVHATKAAKVTVQLKTSDGVKVDVGVKAAGGSGGYSISGSRTRTLESITTFPEYTTTKSGAYKVFNTRATYTTWQTSSYYGGSIQDHVGISSLNGGMALNNDGQPVYDKETSCAACNKTFESAGSYSYNIDIGNKATVELKEIRSKTIDLGLNVSFAGLGANLGVSSVTGTATSVKYSPKSNYALRLYSSNQKTWHCAQKSL